MPPSYDYMKKRWPEKQKQIRRLREKIRYLEKKNKELKSALSSQGVKVHPGRPNKTEQIIKFLDSGGTFTEAEEKFNTTKDRLIDIATGYYSQ